MSEIKNATATREELAKAAEAALTKATADKISRLRQMGDELVAKYAEWMASDPDETADDDSVFDGYDPENPSTDERMAADFEAFALECIADYPVPSEDGPARELALDARKGLVRDVGGKLLFGPIDGDGWQGMDHAVGRELGWW